MFLSPGIILFCLFVESSVWMGVEYPASLQSFLHQEFHFLVQKFLEPSLIYTAQQTKLAQYNID